MDALRGLTDPSLEALRSAFKGLESTFVEIWQAQDDPDYGGPRWYELYRGSPLDETFVCIDFCNNVLHVRRVGREILTLTFFPGWFYDVITNCFTIRGDPSTVYVGDLAAAVPRQFQLFVKRSIPEAQQTFATSIAGRETLVSYTRLPFGYEYEPARAFAVEPMTAAARGFSAWMPTTEAATAQRVHWSALRLRLAAAPGVELDERRLVDEEALADARRVYVPHPEFRASCSQALQLEIERSQNIHALPGLGAPFRDAPLAEADLVAGREMSREGCALALEQVRPDGVDIIVTRPAEASSTAPWLVEAVLELFRSAAVWLEELLGGLPREAPLAVRIRLDVSSPEDRFAYRIQYLDSSRNAHAEPTTDTDPLEPVVRLSVKRTAGVHVFVDQALAEHREAIANRTIEYHEEVLAFEDVPVVLDDSNDVSRRADLPIRPATVGEVLTIAYQLGEFIPLAPVEAFYDMRDLASVGTYLLYGEDIAGEEMTAVDAALTVGGFILPEVGERAVKGLVRGVRRLRTIGDDPFSRLVAAGEAVEPHDAGFLDALGERAVE